MSFLVFCIIPLVISYIYVLVYGKTRRVSVRDLDRSVVFGKIVICLGFNFLLMKITHDFPESSCILTLLLEILSGIDIFILRIPTELLAAAALLSAGLMFRIPLSVVAFVGSILIGIVFWSIREWIGLGAYDILLMVLLGTMLPGVAVLVKYIAVILILWGVMGSIAGVLKNKKDLMIPLVPLITFSYFAVQTFL